MRYFHAGKAIRSFTSAMRSKRLNVDDMSDYLRRDLGLIDGRSMCGSGFAHSDGRSRRLDLLAITPCGA